MSGVDFLYFFQNEPRENIRALPEYIEYSKLIVTLEKTKYRLRYAPYDNKEREQVITRVLTLPDIDDNLKKNYETELKNIRDNREFTINELTKSIDKQIENIMNNGYIKRFYDGDNDIRKLNIMMGLGFIGH